MQTILGAGGVIGTELAKSLPKFTDRIRLVSRNPKKVNASDELLPADLRNAEQTSKAVKGSDVVYLTVGLPYNIKIWQSQWPLVMRNVLDACRKHHAKLVFFDNVYCYGRVEGWMTESTPINPASRKGAVRTQVAAMVMDTSTKGDVQALIARSADFYGPNTPLSFVNVMVFESLKQGKKAQWMINDSVKHSLTYTPDAGKATAILGNTDSAYGQVWHLPTDRNALTGREIVEMAARELNVAPRYTVLPRWMMRMAGLFSGIIRESVEMLYQNESDYLFDSSKFDKVFDFKTTSYGQGFKETVRSMK
ncbi:MAG: NAD-dependent dehydratase [Nitrospirae bacterium GWC2_57_13]|jgi:nucleoside-diphosphate-sugar epimerase|nr:MAG: NAD-dependent dehydratase [Nitrospirae bacterium GWC2_57_13]HAS52931.1 NAD-dependent dehydratase [Nitrospiraceae bacterium]